MYKQNKSNYTFVSQNIIHVQLVEEYLPKLIC